MPKLPEPEDLKMLRHRFSRTIEIWVAYNAFLNREVFVGSDKTCINDVVVFQTTHTLLVAYYSFVYSLFDPSAVDFKGITEKTLSHLPQDAREARDIVLEQWEKIKTPISIIRNNIGFHQSPKQKGASRGYENYGNVHPYSTELIMQALRVFFRRVDSVFESSEPYGNKPAEIDTVVLMDRVKKLEQHIAAHPHEEVFKDLNVLFKDS
ncbi:MAG: hypothetical protein HRU77_09220 [Gammaproteobacteria bacterium]|nr:MAG: hypothetical protein HRU77_09220 [Gammaproteobacteria bacterium]